MTLCQLFASLAEHASDRIRDAHLLQVRQGEVALTDCLLSELARARHPGLAILKTPIDRGPGHWPGHLRVRSDLANAGGQTARTDERECVDNLGNQPYGSLMGGRVNPDVERSWRRL